MPRWIYCLFQQRRRLILVIDRDLHRAIIIEVAERSTARGMLFHQRTPRMFRDVPKLAIGKILVKNRPILVVNIDMKTFHFREHVAIHNEKIFPSVVVEIEKSGAPADVTRVLSKSRIQSYFIEVSIASIAIERFELI